MATNFHFILAITARVKVYSPPIRTLFLFTNAKCQWSSLLIYKTERVKNGRRSKKEKLTESSLTDEVSECCWICGDGN